LNANIIIKKQKVIDRNKCVNDTKSQFLFDQIQERINILCKQIFNVPINADDFSSISPKYFETPTLNSINMFELVKSISLVDEIYLKDVGPSYFEQIQNLASLKEKFKNKDEFLAEYKNLFSKEGFSMLNTIMEYNLMYDELSQLVNFVFDIHTKKIHVINANFKTENYAARSLYFLELRKPSNYFYSYNGKRDLWNACNLPPRTENAFKKMLAASQKNTTSFAQLSDILRKEVGLATSDISPLKTIASHGSEYFSSLAKNNLSKSSFFSSKSAWEKLHEQMPVQSTNLLIIQELTELKFEAKVRHYPAYTVDALYAFSSFAQAEKIKTILENKNIIAHIIPIKDENNIESFQLCVPAINAGQYAKNIDAAKPQRYALQRK
jgi:hypothetical protein